MAVLLCDAEAGEQILKAVAATGKAGGIDRTIVSQGGLWRAVMIGRGQEGADHGLAGDPAVGAGGEQIAGVVIQPVDDLHTGAIG